MALLPIAFADTRVVPDPQNGSIIIDASATNRLIIIRIMFSGFGQVWTFSHSFLWNPTPPPPEIRITSPFKIPATLPNPATSFPQWSMGVHWLYPRLPKLPVVSHVMALTQSGCGYNPI